MWMDPAAGRLDPDMVAEHVLFFSGADIWRNGLFSHSGYSGPTAA
jgi:hypothetical protein